MSPRRMSMNTTPKLIMKRKMEKEMKTIGKLVLIVLVTLSMGCSQVKRVPQNNEVTLVGSRNLVSREVPLTDFDRIEAGIYFDLTIRQGKDFRVVLFVDDNFIDYIQVEKLGTTLSFGFKSGHAYDISGVTLRAEVTMPDLAGLVLSGSSHATVQDFKSTGNLDVELSGSSFFDGSLEAENSTFMLTGSTYLKLVGSVENLRIDACGNSVADLSDYLAENVSIQLSCASQSVVNVTGKLDADASQNSRLFLVDQPTSGDINTYENAFVGQK